MIVSEAANNDMIHELIIQLAGYGIVPLLDLCYQFTYCSWRSIASVLHVGLSLLVPLCPLGWRGRWRRRIGISIGGTLRGASVGIVSIGGSLLWGLGVTIAIVIGLLIIGVIASWRVVWLVWRVVATPPGAALRVGRCDVQHGLPQCVSLLQHLLSNLRIVERYKAKTSAILKTQQLKH